MGKEKFANKFGDLLKKRVFERINTQNIDDNAIRIVLTGLFFDNNMVEHLLSQELIGNIKEMVQILHEEAIVLVDEIRSEIEKGGE